MNIRDLLQQTITNDSGCIVWTATRTPHGYGSIWHDGRQLLAHRLAWELLNGPIPVGLELDHLCRNPACLNVNHLEPVTHKVNVLRGSGPTAINARKTTCPKGHHYDRIDSFDGSRRCKQCQQETQRRYYARRKQR